MAPKLSPYEHGLGHKYHAPRRRTILPAAGGGRGGAGAGQSAPPGQSAEAWAEAQAERYVQAQVDAINEQRKLWEQEQQEAYKRRIEQAKALASYIQAQGFDTRIRDIFSKSGQDIAGMAQGFAGDTRALASANAAEQMNMLSGTGQEGAVRDQGTNMGDVLYGVGGWIPGRSLGETGAAAAADAALQPAFTLQRGQEEAGAALAAGQDQSLEFAKAIADAKAGKFTFKEQLLEDRKKGVLDQLEFRLKTISENRDFWLKKQALYQSMAMNASTLKERRHAQKLADQAEKRAQAQERRYAYETQGRDYEGNLMPGYHLGPQGQVIPPGYKVDKQGNVVKTYKPATSSSGKAKFTPGQQQDILNRIDAQEDSIKAMVTKAIRDGQWYVGSGPPAPKARAKLAHAIYQRYAHLAPTPAAKKLLRQLIQRILNEAQKSGGTAGSTDTIVIPPAGG